MPDSGSLFYKTAKTASFISLKRTLTFLIAITLTVQPFLCGDPENSIVQEIFQAAERQPSLCISLGSADGRLIAALSQQGKVLVHGLAPDAAAMNKARKHIQSLHLYGRISVDTGSFRQMPYADNLANMVIVQDFPALSGMGLNLKEIYRILAPEGLAVFGRIKPAVLSEGLNTSGIKDIAIIKTSNWIMFKKSRPPEMDEWTHWRHDESGDCSSQDTLIGPPSRLRWIDGPMRGRSHHDRPRAALSVGGRNFYIVDEATPYLGVPRCPVLIARDAYNGLVLWKRPVAVGYTKQETENYIKALQGENKRFGFRNWTNYHALRLPLPQRAMVATRDRVYAVIEKDGPLVAIEAGTGKIIKTYEGPSPNTVIHHNGRLVLISEKNIFCLNASDGRKLWSFDEPVKDGVMAGGKVFCISLNTWPPEAVCLNLEDGTVGWRAPLTDLRKWPDKKTKRFSLNLIFCRKKTLIFSGVAAKRNGAIDAISAKDGRYLWSRRGASKGRIQPTAFWLHDLVWYSGKGEGYANTWMGLDPVSGEVKKSFKARKYQPRGQKCNLNNATVRYIIAGMMEFIDPVAGTQTSTWIGRGVCSYGVLPANGLTYVFPTDCICFPMLRGNMALAGSEQKAEEEPASADALEKGPVFGKPAEPENSAGPGDWPCYRHDARRSGCASTPLPANVKQVWEKQPGGRISAPSIAGNTVYIAAIDEHRIDAMDAGSGKTRWSYCAGARVTFPPTIHKGLCIFGSQDGRVYCLHASDGALVWRYRAAPHDKRISAYGQLESKWPVQGSILIAGGIAYFAAGRSTQADSGIFLYALDPHTGKVLWKMQPQGNTVADMLLMEKGALYMWKRKFDPKTGRKLEVERDQDVFLMAGNTFFNNVWSSRTAWHYGDNRWHYKASGTRGHLLALDGENLFGVKVLPYKRGQAGKYRWAIPGKNHYQLFGVLKKGQNDLKPEWSAAVPLRMRAMVPAGDKVFVAGEEDAVYPKRSELRCFSTAEGKELSSIEIPAPPVLDGMAAAGEKIYLSTEDGIIRCFGKK